MGVKKIKGSKKRFETTEEVLSFSERATDFAKQNPYWLIGIVATLVLAMGVIWGVHLYTQAQERKASSDYARVMEKWPASDLAGFKEWDKLTVQLQDYIKKHEGTQAALNAQLDLTQAYFWMKRYDESIKLANRLLAQTPSGNPLKPLIHYHLALAYEETGKADQSIGQWEALAKEGVKGLDREISWHLARLYSDKKEYAKAVEQYEKALQADGGYPDTPMIQEEMAVAKLKVEQDSEGSKQGQEKKDQKS